MQVPAVEANAGAAAVAAAGQPDVELIDAVAVVVVTADNVTYHWH